MWIPVDIAVPKKPRRVLVSIKYSDNQPPITEIGEYFGDGVWQVHNIQVNVVAWQLLPEYEEKNNG